MAKPKSTNLEFWPLALLTRPLRRLLSSTMEAMDAAYSPVATRSTRGATGRTLSIAPRVVALARRRKKVPTFAVYSDDWLERRVRAGLKSERDYRSMLNRHLLPVFGKRRLTAVKPSIRKRFMTSVAL